MTSGVQIADNVVTFYNDMKISKNADQRVRLATFDFKGKCIDVDEVHTQADLDKKKMDGFEYFKSLLISDKCCYIVYDCHFATKEQTTKEELVFVMWCPDGAKPKDKMNYAASKETLVKKLTGIKHNFQINDPADCSDRNTFSEKLGKTVISVEGVPVSYEV